MKILGHRGCITNNGPYQNSIKAFEWALKNTDGFETDACLSADGDIFFIHEEIYDDNGQGIKSTLSQYLDEASKTQVNQRFLSDLSTKEVQQLRLKDGQKIPQWDDVVQLFKTYPDKIFNIELKGENVASTVIQKLKKEFNNKKLNPNQVVISSFNHPALLEVRKELPMLKIGALFLSKDKKKIPINPLKNNKKSGYYLPLNNENLINSIVQEISPNYIIIPHTELNETQIRLIQNTHPTAKIVTWVYTELENFNASKFKQELEKLEKSQIISSIIIDQII